MASNFPTTDQCRVSTDKGYTEDYEDPTSQRRRFITPCRQLLTPSWEAHREQSAKKSVRDPSLHFRGEGAYIRSLH